MNLRNTTSKFLHTLLKDRSIRVLSGPLKGWQWLPRSGNHAYWLGYYEKDYVNLFSQYVKAGDVVYDIGAQAGYFTLIASRLAGDRGQVFTFEPVPGNIANIQEHCRLNNCHNVKVLDVAVGGSSGTRTFQTGNAFMGHLSNQEDASAPKEGALEIQVVALDELLEKREIAPPTIMKIDIEGMDYWVLRGGEKLIATYRPILFIATHGKKNQERVVQLLQDWNYDVQMIGSGTERNADYLAKPMPIHQDSHSIS